MSQGPLLPRLGVNIDHVATLRQLRGTSYPDIQEAARICVDSGADQITVHLREDRRHIQDEDVKKLRKHLSVPLNLEMAVSDEITRFAVKLRPDWVCLVPEKRQEVTTEGGLAVQKQFKKIATTVARLKKAKIKVSLFVEPDLKVLPLCQKLGVEAIEIHTGKYCLKPSVKELQKIVKVAEHAKALEIRPHAGHGFDYKNVRAVAAKDIIEEFNIGHSIVCRSVMVGLSRAVKEMKSALWAP